MSVSAKQINELANKLASGQSIHDIMRHEEFSHGYKVVKPGDEPWLPADDWDETSVVSINGKCVRLVAINAPSQLQRECPLGRRASNTDRAPWRLPGQIAVRPALKRFQLCT